MTKNELAAAWIELQSQPEGSERQRELSWAADKLYMAVLRDPDECWKLILEILNQTSDEWVLTNLAAGPVEELLAQHGEKAISWIEERAATDSQFRALLNSVWKNAMSEETWQRLRAIAKR